MYKGKQYKIKLSIHQFNCLLLTPRKLVIVARNKVLNVKMAYSPFAEGRVRKFLTGD